MFNVFKSFVLAPDFETRLIPVGKDDFQLDFFLIDPGVPSDGKNQARCATKTFSQPHTPSPFLLKTSPPVQNTPKRAFSAKELELSEHPRLVASCLPVS